MKNNTFVSVLLSAKTKVLKSFRAYPLAFVLLLIVIVVSFLADNYFSAENIFNVLRQISVIGILACGMTYVIIAGGIDLSVGAIISFCGALVINFVTSVGFIPALLITLSAGGVIGFISGFIITRIRGALGEAFMITFGMQTVVAAVALIYTGGIYQQAIDNVWFNNMGRGITPIIIFVVIAALMQFLLTKTRFGRNIYFIGGNIRAATLSGINVKLIRPLVFMISGVMAGAAGLLLTARVGTASPTAGIGYELDAIAAVLVGGVSMSGGKGSILNTVLGVVIMGVLGNALNMMNVSSYPQMIIKGVVIVLAVSLDVFNKRREELK